MEVLDGAELRERLATLIQQSKRVRIAVAFWGDGAIEELQIDTRADMSVVCNLRTGGTNPSVIEKMRQNGVEVRHRDDLHAKIYLFDGHAVVGSSNVSANGLSYQEGECTGWLEANVLFSGRDLLQQVEAQFDRAWAGAAPVKDEDLRAAYQAWSRRRQPPITIWEPANRPPTLIEALGRNPAEFSGRRIYVVMFCQEMSSQGTKALKAEQESSGKGEKLDAYENWDDLPEAATLISFHVGAGGGSKLEGLWLMPSQRRLSEPLRNGHRLNFCDRLDQIFGYRAKNIGDWRKAIQKAFRSGALGNNDAVCIEIGDFAREFLID